MGLSWPSWRAKSGRPKQGLLGTGVPPDRTGHLDAKSRISLHPGHFLKGRKMAGGLALAASDRGFC